VSVQFSHVVLYASVYAMKTWLEFVALKGLGSLSV